MARDKPDQTPVDYVTIVLSPVLIMGLVGSLVFFLLEVFYKTDGPWKERLQWILFFYVFGVVLVARISMNSESASRSSMYGIVLAILTYLGMQAFVEYPEAIRSIAALVNLFLIGIVWWCAHRLTWDCTNIDESTDMSGEGLLQAAGIVDAPVETQATGEDVVEAEVEESGNWWTRYQKWRDQRKKKRTLGVWIVYFSLAALPIFGLGQSLIPLTAPERRQFSFWLMMIYVGCGLGLLLTTCFLGLRRYLRQKRLEMPAAMTGTWLGLGAGLIVGLLLVGAFLPRPYSEYPLFNFTDPAGSKKRQASQFAVKGDSPGEGKGQPGQKGDPDAKNGDGRPGEKGKEGGGKDKGGKSGSGGDKGSGGKDGKSNDGKGNAEKGNDKGGSKGQKGEQGGKGNKAEKSEQGEKGEKGEKNDRGSKSDDSQKTGDALKKMEQNSSSQPQLARVQEFLQRVAPWLKWLVFAVLALLVGLALFRGALGFFANFTDWAKKLLAAWRNFWARLFGQTQPTGASGQEEDERAEKAERVVPFSAFPNPFETGEADRKTPRELVRYTFAAVQAWARERDLGHEASETAMEFLDRLGGEIPALETMARQLGQLHARAEYARGGLPTSTVDFLRAFWEKLERVAVAPMSA